MTKLDKLLAPLKHAEYTREINKLLIPVTIYNMDYNGKEKWNQIYREVIKDSLYKKINRTKSLGISHKRKLSEGIKQYDVTYSGSCVELTIINVEGMWRIQFRHQNKDKDNNIKGRRAFMAFKKMCEDDGIDFNSYAVKNGKEVKEEIEKPWIKLSNDCYKNVIFEGAHHIDFHSSYPAGLVNTHPEFRNVVQDCYDKRGKNKFYKAILNYSIGFMQSLGGCHARYAQLSKDAIRDNNIRLEEISNRLENNGRKVIAYNVDGVWYSGEIYHGEGEGDNFGEWINDHINCKLRFKSAGAYEFIENGLYTPVIRGLTRMDKIKDDRSKWVWGDIYSEDCEIIRFNFIEGVGILDEKEQIKYLQETISKLF